MDSSSDIGLNSGTTDGIANAPVTAFLPVDIAAGNTQGFGLDDAVVNIKQLKNYSTSGVYTANIYLTIEVGGKTQTITCPVTLKVTKTEIKIVKRTQEYGYKKIDFNKVYDGQIMVINHTIQRLIL